MLLLLVRGLEDKNAEQDRILAMANLMSVSVGQPGWCLCDRCNNKKYPTRHERSCLVAFARKSALTRGIAERILEYDIHLTYKAYDPNSKMPVTRQCFFISDHRMDLL